MCHCKKFEAKEESQIVSAGRDATSLSKVYHYGVSPGFVVALIVVSVFACVELVIISDLNAQAQIKDQVIRRLSQRYTDLLQMKFSTGGGDFD